ncbi:hypothetical protein CHARACLAT_027599 [Characodon lateralis]|uniref:Uncharacterized protein n=1 Tax=Characodon lateralis TaxID=208331 RepID=A0ABU7DUV4_9TELE|nr:hypothetical protein [Characodon lateralis]
MDKRQRGPVWPAGLIPRSLKEELWDWHGVKDPPDHSESQWHDFMFQRSCQKLQSMCARRVSRAGRKVSSEKVNQQEGNDY